MEKSYSYKPVQFFLIAILITWTTWLIAAYLSYQQDSGSNQLFSMLMFAGLFPPFAAALWMIFTSNSRELKQNFYDRLFDLRLIKLSSLPAIFLIMPLAVIISVFLSHLFFGQSLDQLTFVKTAPHVAGLIPVPVMFFGAALIEELGWKGYGVDSLRGKRTFFAATLIYAALWTLWHIPLFFINNYYHNTLLRMNPLFALNFIASIFPAAFIINWLWFKNRGSIFTAVLFHATANFQGILQMGQIAKCIETVVLIATAVTIVVLNKKIFFEKFPAQIGYFGAKNAVATE
jgi:membrane protease YdiL (CAAX protease family)